MCGGRRTLGISPRPRMARAEYRRPASRASVPSCPAASARALERTPPGVGNRLPGQRCRREVECDRPPAPADTGRQLEGCGLVKPPRLRFLLDWNQRVSNAYQLIRPPYQAISTRTQSWCACSRIIRRLNRSSAQTDARTLAPTPEAQQCIHSKDQDQQQDERAHGPISPPLLRNWNSTAASSATMTSTTTLCARCQCFGATCMCCDAAMLACAIVHISHARRRWGRSTTVQIPRDGAKFEIRNF